MRSVENVQGSVTIQSGEVLSSQIPFRENRFLQLLIAAMLAVMALSAYHPAMVFDWYLENLLVVVLVVALTLSYYRVPLSRGSYLLIFFYLCCHEWGAHHKYADVPLGEWMKVWFHTTRNHYDRVMHFVFGLFLGYPMMEAFAHLTGIRNAWLYWLPMEASLAFGAIYEIIESIVASIISPGAGEAFVGMQNDPWDAQKDMGLGFIGAVVAMAIVWLADRQRGNNYQRFRPF